MCSGVGMKLKVGEGGGVRLIKNIDKQKKRVFCSGYVSGTYVLKVMYNFEKRVGGGGLLLPHPQPPPFPTPSYDVCVCASFLAGNYF